MRCSKRSGMQRFLTPLATVNPGSLGPEPPGKQPAWDHSALSPVGDLGGQPEAPERRQQAGHALLEALRLARVAGRRDDGHADARAHQDHDVVHLRQVRRPSAGVIDTSCDWQQMW